MNILANDKISQSGIDKMEKAGFRVIREKIPKEKLADYINENDIEILLVRSATKVRKNTIDACPGLKLIGRGGVGVDNIDVDYAESKGIKVINTPAASSRSVAELVFGHLLNGVRHLKNSNRDMPLEGDKKFKELKKRYKGTELQGKTLGVIGFGRIGQEVSRIALGIGMNVLARKDKKGKLPITLCFANDRKIELEVSTAPKEEVLRNADFITVHTPATGDYLIGEKEIEQMKDSAGLINTSRGGIVDEAALDKALNDGKLAFAALDVYENEPTPPIKLLMNPHLSLSPHIGGGTEEAQDRIGVELADEIIALFGN